MKIFSKRIFNILFLVLGFFIQSQTAFAQAYVPVEDIKLNPAFSQYATDFNNYVSDLFKRWDNTFGAAKPNGTTDSLRDLISGSNPDISGLGGKCKAGDNLPPGLDNSPNQQYPAFAYTTGPWNSASASATPFGSLPLTIPPGGSIDASGNYSGPYVQVNYSASLRCLLQEVVEWQKLGISVQIQQLLKNYIADAQTAQLNKQLMNRITAANLNFGKAGNVVNNGGTISTQAVYNVNPAQNNYNVNQRQLDEATDEAVNDPAALSPQGSWGICQPWRLDAAADMTRNNRTTTEDPFNYPQKQTECNLNAAETIDPANWDNYSQNINDPSGNGLATLRDGLLNPQDTPLGASSIAYAEAKQRIANQQKVTDQKAANPGYLPTTQYDTTNPADPHSLDMQYGLDNTPSSENGNNLNSLVQGQNEQVANSMTLDSQAATSSEVAATLINTNTGLAGADTLPLQTSQSAVNQLVKEFYDSINIGYFGTQGNTRQWAQGTMLSIYDEMKFNDQQPSTQVTNGRATVDTGY